MLDHQEARLWADHHKAFASWTRTIAGEIGEAFRVLARLQYDEPWKQAPAPAKTRVEAPRRRARAID